ncbi:MAG TPA: hypothetical protein VFD73_13815, partial [Gemmatimonadales bacterium]|nr:hypothetical protein [Gemmatimonadales bacterium]
MRNWITWTAVAGLVSGVAGCSREPHDVAAASRKTESPIEKKLAQYTSVRLTTDLSKLTAHERQMIPLLIDAAKAMDAIFWRQAY